MNIEGSYDEAVQGCEGVFHMATPMDFESDNPEVCSYKIESQSFQRWKDDGSCDEIMLVCWQNEVIKPTIDGMMSIMRSCAKAKTVKKLIFTNSAGTLNVEEHQKTVYDETNWSDLDFIYSKKMTGWVGFLFLFSLFLLSYCYCYCCVWTKFFWDFTLSCRCILCLKFWLKKQPWKQQKSIISTSSASYHQWWLDHSSCLHSHLAWSQLYPPLQVNFQVPGFYMTWV